MVLKAASVIGVTTLESRPCLPAWSKGNLAPSLPMMKEHLSTINSAAPLVINRNSKGEVGEVHVTSQLRDNVEVLADCNWAGVYKMLEGRSPPKKTVLFRTFS